MVDSGRRWGQMLHHSCCHPRHSRSRRPIGFHCVERQGGHRQTRRVDTGVCFEQQDVRSGPMQQKIEEAHDRAAATIRCGSLPLRSSLPITSRMSSAKSVVCSAVCRPGATCSFLRYSATGLHKLSATKPCERQRLCQAGFRVGGAESSLSWPKAQSRPLTRVEEKEAKYDNADLTKLKFPPAQRRRRCMFKALFDCLTPTSCHLSSIRQDSLGISLHHNDFHSL